MGILYPEPSSQPSNKRFLKEENRMNQRVIKKNAHAQKAIGIPLSRQDIENGIPAAWPMQRRWANRFLAFVIELNGGIPKTASENIDDALERYGVPAVPPARRSIMAFDAAREISRSTGLSLPPEYNYRGERNRAC